QRARGRPPAVRRAARATLAEVPMSVPHSMYLRLGSVDDVPHGKQVSQVRTALGLEVTGTFDGDTDAAVRAFQKSVFPDQWKEWDGIVGPKTRAKMFPLSDTQRATGTAAVATGRKWLTVVTNRFNLDVIFPTAVVNDTRTKTKNVFDFDPFPPPDDPAAVIDSLQKV